LKRPASGITYDERILIWEAKFFAPFQESSLNRPRDVRDGLIRALALLSLKIVMQLSVLAHELKEGAGESAFPTD